MYLNALPVYFPPQAVTPRPPPTKVYHILVCFEQSHQRYLILNRSDKIFQVYGQLRYGTVKNRALLVSDTNVQFRKIIIIMTNFYCQGHLILSAWKRH